MTTSLHVLAYTRQSVGKAGETEETSLSLNAQLDRITAHCAREGWQIVETIADHDLSGERWDRPGLQQLLDRVKAGGVDRVVVFSISRIARKVLHQEMVMDVLTEHGAQLVSVTEAGLDNILVRVVHAGMAEQHNANHRKILRATFEARAKRGLHHGRPPFGYRVRTGETRGLDIDPDEAEIVQEVYRRRADGESLMVIATWLQERGVRGNHGATQWHQSAVRLMLSRPIYAGYAVYRDAIVGDILPEHAAPIIDRPLWHQVQRTLGGPQRQRRPPSQRRSWLDGLAWHGCGNPMGTYIGSAGAVAFRCNKATAPALIACREPRGQITQEAIEMAVLHCLAVDLAAIPTDPAAVVRTHAETMGRPNITRQRDKLTRQRGDLVDQIARAEQLVTTGRRDFVWFDAFDKDAQERLAALDAELATLSAFPTEEDIAHRIADIKRLVPQAEMLALSPESARLVVAALGRVVFREGVVSIDYAPEYRALFPHPECTRPKYSKRHERWTLIDPR